MVSELSIWRTPWVARAGGEAEQRKDGAADHGVTIPRAIERLNGSRTIAV